LGKWHNWTDEERGIIRREYSHTRTSAILLAEKISHLSSTKVTEFAVKGQISMMGIAKRSDRHPWSQKQKDTLERLMPRYSPRTVARMMHRSVNSVVVMSKRLGISRRHRDGWFTKREVCEILGVGHKWVQRRIDSGALRATPHYETIPQKLGGSAWHIEETDLRDFIRRYPEALTARNVDLIMIVDILAGIPNNNH